MTINNIRKKLFNYLNKDVLVVVNGSRNKNDLIYGKVVNVYNYIFVILCNDGSLKSFSFSDVLIGNIIISENNE